MRGAEPQRQRGGERIAGGEPSAGASARRRSVAPSATPLVIPVPSASLAPSPS